MFTENLLPLGFFIENRKMGMVYLKRIALFSSAQLVTFIGPHQFDSQPGSLFRY